MRSTLSFAFLLCLVSGCTDKSNQVVDTTNRRPPPDAKEMQDYNAAMEAAAKENPSP
jgi:hypothetical protein